MEQKCIIFCAPSGAGKTTIVRYLLGRFGDCMSFSISATSRPPRGEEKDGHDYYFLSHPEFMQKVAEDAFIEWEEVYKGTAYGTLKSEIERIWKEGNCVIFDVDVQGGMNLKKYFGDKALSVFVMPPNEAALRHRLEKRGTETPEKIQMRLDKASEEMAYSKNFDVVLLNDELERALQEAETKVGAFLS